MTGAAEDPHHQGIRRVHGVQDPGPGGERLLPQVSSRRTSSPGSPGCIPPLCVSPPWPWPSCRPSGPDAPSGPARRLGASGSTGPSPSWSSAAPALWSSASLSASLPASAGPATPAYWSRALTIWRPCPKPKSVVFDKTGTLTQGVFEVNGIHHHEMDEREAGGVRRSGGERFQPPHQQKPAAGLWPGDRPQPGDGCSGDQRQRRHRQSGRRGGSRRQRQADGPAGRAVHPLSQRRHHHPHGRRSGSMPDISSSPTW